MLDFFRSLFDTSDFRPRWECGNWSSEHGWLHIISDLGVWSAYTAIPLVLAYFVLRRRDIPFPRIFWLFGAFIFACGTTHLLDSLMFWWPAYRLSGMVKLATAIISWITVLALLPIVPLALSLKSPKQLEQTVDQRTRELRDKEARIRAVFEATADAIVTYDETGLIESHNPACETLFGRRDEALTGQQVQVLVADGDTAGFRQPGKHELVGQRSDGSKFPLRLSVAELTLEGRRMFTASIHDLTEILRSEEERRSLEARIQQVQKLESLGILAGGIAHDFNNLLVAIIGNADLVKEELPANSPAHEYLQSIGTASTRAADLCRQMLAYSGRGRFVIRTFRLSQIVREMAGLLEASIPKTTVLRYDCPDDLPLVEGDVTQIRQVVLNLITNAADAIGSRGGTVDIQTGVMNADKAYLEKGFLYTGQPAGRYVFVEVRDDGGGMDPATMARMFDPFFSTKGAGRGLGLSAVLGIVRGHHGAIRVQSELGRGTTIRLLIPEAAQAIEPAPAAPPVAGSWRGEGLVLIIDDEPEVASVVKRMLEASGFSTRVAIGGANGVKEFADHREQIRLVVLDLTMPHVDGEAVFREIRRMKPEARVLLYSGYTEHEVTARFAGQGLAGFVQKPFTLKELLSKVREALK